MHSWHAAASRAIASYHRAWRPFEMSAPARKSQSGVSRRALLSRLDPERRLLAKRLAELD
jgi:hypothetical protein